MQRRNIVCDSGTLPISNKMGSGAWLGLEDETSELYTQTCVYILACEWRAMQRLEAYFNDTVGF